MLTRLTFVAVAASMLFSASAPALADTMTRDTQDVRAAYAAFMGAQNQHDLAAVQKMLWTDPNLVWLTVSGPIFGPKAVLGHFKEVFAGVWSATPDYSKTHIVLRSASTADVIAPVSVTATAGHNPYSAKAIVVTMFVRTEQGWKVAGIVPVSAAVKGY